MKRKDDMAKAIQDREKAVYLINKSLPPEYRISPIHENLSLNNSIISTNLLKNRIIPTDIEDSCGLMYKITGQGKKKSIPIIFLFNNNLYIKSTNDFRGNAIEFLKSLQAFGVHIILVELKKEKFSNPIPINIFLSYWGIKQCSSKGNGNRINICGKPRTINKYNLRQSQLLEGSVIDCLTRLLA